MKTFIGLVIIVLFSFALGFFVFNFLILPILVGSGKNIEVPNVIGKPLISAQKIIIDANLTLGNAKSVFDTIYPFGYVINQKPTPGAKVKKGRKIDLLVSKGPMLVKVPFVNQMSMEQGLRVLLSLGIQSVSVESLRSSTIPAGKIIGIEPGPGSEVPVGSRLKLYVSSGLTGTFLMPMLVGLPLNAAIESVVNNGLIVGSVEEVPSQEPMGLVIVQYPEDGMKVKTGDTVRLIVSGKKR
ncbi:MAG: PASTA domain-containing protein [candidate division WOR-3 bacterium]|nr:PASTA domain-containing protein [candidate division WOR-3 bacterium]